MFVDFVNTTLNRQEHAQTIQCCGAIYPIEMVTHEIKFHKPINSCYFFSYKY